MAKITTNGKTKRDEQGNHWEMPQGVAERLSRLGMMPLTGVANLEDLLNTMLDRLEKQESPLVNARDRAADIVRRRKEPTDAELDARATRAHSLTALSAEDQARLDRIWNRQDGDDGDGTEAETQRSDSVQLSAATKASSESPTSAYLRRKMIDEPDEAARDKARLDRIWNPDARAQRAHARLQGG